MCTVFRAMRAPYPNVRCDVPPGDHFHRTFAPWLRARHLDPGELLVDADVAGEAEHPLAEDVAHDLGGAALDRVGPGPEERLLERVVAHRLLRRGHLVAAVE